MEETLSLILDVAIFMSLAVTIFYAIRLNKSLSNFRSYKGEFEHLMQEVAQSIEHAQETMAELKAATRRTGEDLQKKIDSANSISRKPAVEPKASEPKPASFPQAQKVSRDADTGRSPFSIQDRDFEAPAQDPDDNQMEMPAQSQPKSRAEQELLEALSQRKQER